ncbi:copper chaperone PCu(A)C [Parvularcula oceani]|uniref:copper chaperone PCu(A)C n=1 Tax=Parvularcula oceani TaxID=1247963 RepID=UPI000B293DEC|nr:copper chaperone PCu(A)C [Parvularcula oceani]
MRILTPFAKAAALGALSLAAACGAGEERGDAAAGMAAQGGEGLVISNGYVRPAAPGAMATAGYATLTSEAGDALVSVRAPGFRAVELHTVIEEDGVSRMRPLDRLALPAGEAVSLAPGGAHLMMMGPEAPLEEGGAVEVTFTFESGETETVSLPVERR